MAKDTTREIAKKELEGISVKAEINEAYFAGLLWADPFEAYAEYSDTLAQDEFVHEVWGFYFELGRRMYGDGIKVFDEITVKIKVKEYNLDEEFKEYGGLVAIEDAVSIVSQHSSNIEYYYETIKKNYTIRQLYLLFGNKVLIKKNKYDYNEMNREQLTMFWTDKINQVGLGGINRYEAENLYIDPDEFIRKLEEESAEMLPFYNSYLMNSITQGVARGHVFMWGGFGNTGKSSMMADKFVMSCIDNKEKLIIVLNEEDAQSFRQKIVLSILNHEYKQGFDRKHMVNGGLTDSDKALIRKALKMKELIEGDEARLK
jgi:replicative DNA helicase